MEHHIQRDKAGEFLFDFFQTFALLLDPNLPRRQPRYFGARDDRTADHATMQWPGGQVVAFGIIALSGVVGTVAIVFSYTS